MLLSDRVLFLDGEAIIIDKPAGLPVDTPRDKAVSVESHLKMLTFGFARVPLAVHRLDRDTSGCLLLARNPKAHKKFAAAFEAGIVRKTYLAILDGIPDAREGIVDMALGKTSTEADGWRMVPDPKGKRAVSHWRVLTERDGRALIEFTPETGRTHQLRVHAASGIGIPIAGDPVYGTGNGRGPMLLHARHLKLDRAGKKPVEATAPLPPSFLYAGYTEADAEPTDG
jgi:tRNA pseudouridine32 synthase/23S rRNA pseudouridine746 synthase